ncbi:AzlD domain-containing protein [Zobellella maritima]|uniref:AzlD domain-containing protein n=1 Tax=Zobellella maritima TaxID=2059725 RepID=UPI000E301510|nr:AzlD domain-containing protein [Zobellella maritima]
MDNLTLWLIFITVGIGTFAIRLSFIHLHGRENFNIGKHQRVLQLLAPAVLAALSIPAIIFQDKTVLDSVSMAQITAASVTAILAWYFRGVFWPLCMGMVTFWILKFYVF